MPIAWGAGTPDPVAPVFPTTLIRTFRSVLRVAREGRGRPFHPSRGFTLLEVVLAVAIVAILAQVANAAYQNYRDRIDIARAVLDVGSIGAEITQYGVDHRGLPSSLADIGRDTLRDPWGNPYQYLNHDGLKGNGALRKDKNIVPINSDFDLYSMGKDGQSTSPLTASHSRDDIVRANNGRFVGLAFGLRSLIARAKARAIEISAF